MLLSPMAVTGQEAVGSMGTDTPHRRAERLAPEDPSITYFKQNFAQVTNPPIDPIREELVMSLVSPSSARGRTSSTWRAPRASKRLEVRQPILTNEDLEKIRGIGLVEDSLRHQAPST